MYCRLFRMKRDERLNGSGTLFNYENKIEVNKLTCFPRITMTSAAPAAVRAHVNSVPRSACVIGE